VKQFTFAQIFFNQVSRGGSVLALGVPTRIGTWRNRKELAEYR